MAESRKFVNSNGNSGTATTDNTSAPSGYLNAPDPTTKSDLRAKIENRLRILLKEHYKDDDSGKEMLKNAIRSCHKLAVLVQDHLNPPRWQRSSGIENFGQLARTVLGPANIGPIPIMWKV
jgi:hypothetical protein